MPRSSKWDDTEIYQPLPIHTDETVSQMSHTKTAVCKNVRPPVCPPTIFFSPMFGRKIFGCQLSWTPRRTRTLVDAWIFLRVALNFPSNEWQTCDQMLSIYDILLGCLVILGIGCYWLGIDGSCFVTPFVTALSCHLRYRPNSSQKHVSFKLPREVIG